MTTVAWDLSEAIAGLVEANGSSVVRVDARWNRGASGVVFSQDGVIVTANHAVERDENVSVALADGARHAAQIVGRDPATDIAVLRIAATGLAVPSWGGANDVKVGHLALSIGRPGRSARASLGIVGTRSTESFRTPAGGRLDGYVQLDGGLAPGFSGGLTLDARGRALGMNTTGIVRGGALVVPEATLRRVVDEVVAHGHVRKGYLGVGVYPVRLPPALETSEGQRTGALLVAIEAGSPAERAGLLVGDVLLAIDGQLIAHPADLSAQLEARQGTEVTAKIARAGAVQHLRLTPGERT
jgi:S1-C subfamily serine protease